MGQAGVRGHPGNPVRNSYIGYSCCYWSHYLTELFFRVHPERLVSQVNLGRKVQKETKAHPVLKVKLVCLVYKVSLETEAMLA